jgi:hypothetical protein
MAVGAKRPAVVAAAEEAHVAGAIADDFGTTMAAAVNSTRIDPSAWRTMIIGWRPMSVVK